MLLRWRPSRLSDKIAFFSLECAGPAGCIGAELKYKEVYRDPPSQQEGPKCRYQFKLGGLDPATSYLFRVRAVNGCGASDYVYVTATTRLVMAIYPRVVKLSQNSVTLRWLFTPQSHRRLAQLRKLYFEGIQNNPKYCDGKIAELEKEDLAVILDNACDNWHELKHFLQRLKARLGIRDYSVSIAIDLKRSYH